MASPTEAERIERGWEWLEKDLNAVTPDATARELAGIAWRANNGYFGVRDEERLMVLSSVGSMAVEQAATALELGLPEDRAQYTAVLEQSRAWELGEEPNDDPSIGDRFNTILNPNYKAERPNVYIRAERLMGKMHALQKPGADTNEVRKALSDLVETTEAALADYEKSATVPEGATQAEAQIDRAA